MTQEEIDEFQSENEEIAMAVLWASTLSADQMRLAFGVFRPARQRLAALRPAQRVFYEPPAHSAGPSLGPHNLRNSHALGVSGAGGLTTWLGSRTTILP